MRMKVDTEGLTFLLVKDATPVVDWETKQAKTDEDGVPLYQAQLVALGDGAADIINVRLAGRPEGLTVNGFVAIEGLTVQPWQMGERAGLSFRAASIRDGLPARAATGAARSGTSNGAARGAE